MATVEITTKIGCPLACTFCPQDALTKASNTKEKRNNSKMMTVEMFEHILNKLPSHVRIDFSGFSEPFANPNCGKLIKLAADSPNPLAVYTTLQGVNSADVELLKNLIISNRFEQFVIHLPDNHGNMLGFKLCSEYIYALKNLGVLDNVGMMTMSKNAKIKYEVINEISKEKEWNLIRKKLPKDSFIGVRRAGSLNVSKFKSDELLEEVNWKCAISCKSTPFYDHNVILPSGEVALCCMDYGLKHILGNFDNGYYEMFRESKELAKVISTNMGGEGETICKKCENVNCFSDEKGKWIDQNLENINNYKKSNFLTRTKKIIKQINNLF